MNFPYLSNTEELANISQETCVEAIHGPLRYLSEAGGWQLDDIDLNQESTFQ